MEKAQAEGEKVCLQPRHRGGSKVCALHLNGHPVTNTDEPRRVMLYSQGLYLMGKQEAIAWKSMDFFASCFLTAKIYAVKPFVEVKNSKLNCQKPKDIEEKPSVFRTHNSALCSGYI